MSDPSPEPRDYHRPMPDRRAPRNAWLAILAASMLLVLLGLLALFALTLSQLTQEDWGVVLGAFGIFVALVALLAVFVAELAKRPRLSIEPWGERVGDDRWEFAAIRVVNQPLPQWAAPWFVRQTATEVTCGVEFLRGGDHAFKPYLGRWSNQAEPVGFGWATADVEKPSVLAGFYDTWRAVAGWSTTIPPGKDGRQLAVAILSMHAAAAHAFGSESYNQAEYDSPMLRRDWKLEMGATYRVRLKLDYNGITSYDELELPYLTNRPEDYYLRRPPGRR